MKKESAAPTEPRLPPRTARTRARSVTVERGLAPGVTMLEGRRGGLYPFVNAFRLDPPSGECCLIDPGFGHLAYIQARHAEFRHVINSHYHPEHTSYNRLFDLPVRIHPLDAPAVLSLDEIRRRYGPLDGALLEEWRAWLRYAADWAEANAVAPLSQGFVDSLGFPGLRLLHTPGHTPGHVCLFFERTGLLLSFDIDLAPTGPWFGHAASDPDAWLATMDMLIALAPRAVYSSHQPAEPAGGIERLRAYHDAFTRREETLTAYLKEPRATDELSALACKLFYGGITPRPKPIWEYFAKTTLGHHLKRLERLGRIARCDAAGDAWRSV